MVLDKLPGPGRPTSLDKSRARVYCTCSRCGWGCLDIFTLIYPFSFLSPTLWETTRYRLKYCLKGSLSPKTTNQIEAKITRLAKSLDFFAYTTLMAGLNVFYWPITSLSDSATVQ